MFEPTRSAGRFSFWSTLPYLLTGIAAVLTAIGGTYGLGQVNGIPGPRGAVGPAGPVGAQGSAGADGKAGKDGTTPTIQRQIAYRVVSIKRGQWAYVNIYCPNGMMAVGGGYYGANLPDVYVNRDSPAEDTTLSSWPGLWLVEVHNGSTADITIRMFAVCLSGLTSLNPIDVSQ